MENEKIELEIEDNLKDSIISLLEGYYDENGDIRCIICGCLNEMCGCQINNDF